MKRSIILRYATGFLVALSGFGALNAGEKDGGEKLKSSLTLGKIALAVGVPAALGVGWYLYKHWSKPAVPTLGHMPFQSSQPEIIMLKQGGAYCPLDIPKKLEDERWKELFGEPVDEKLLNQLEKLIHSYLEQSLDGRKPHEFLRAAMQLVAPHMKRFELQVLSSKGTGLLSLFEIPLSVTSCSFCSAGRYHLSDVPEKNNDYEARRLLFPKELRVEFHIRVPTHEFLLKDLTHAARCWQAIFSLMHEMMHIARLHSGTECLPDKALSYMQEFESDIALPLVLSNGSSHSLQEYAPCGVAMLYSARRLIAGWHRLGEGVLVPGSDPDAVENWKFTREGSEIHPSDLARIKNIVTVWVAHLMHNEKVDKQTALAWVEQNVRKAYRLCYFDLNVNNSDPYAVVDIMLNDLINEWRKEHESV